MPRNCQVDDALSARSPLAGTLQEPRRGPRRARRRSGAQQSRRYAGEETVCSPSCAFSRGAPLVGAYSGARLLHYHHYQVINHKRATRQQAAAIASNSNKQKTVPATRRPLRASVNRRASLRTRITALAPSTKSAITVVEEARFVTDIPGIPQRETSTRTFRCNRR